MRAEVRAHDQTFRASIVNAMKRTFEAAAATVSNSENAVAACTIQTRTDYEAFRLNASEPCIVEIERAIGSIGPEPFRAVAGGGTDANWMCIHPDRFVRYRPSTSAYLPGKGGHQRVCKSLSNRLAIGDQIIKEEPNDNRHT